MRAVYDLVATVIEPQYAIRTEGFLTCRLLQKGGEKLLFVFNYDPVEGEAVIQIPGVARVESLRGAAATGEPPELRVRVAPRDVAVFHLS